MITIRPYDNVDLHDDDDCHRDLIHATRLIELTEAGDHGCLRRCDN